MKLKITSNTLLQIAILLMIAYFVKGEKIMVVLPIFVGTTYISHMFVKDILKSLVMSSVLSYTLLIVLYKDHYREYFTKRQNSHNTMKKGL